MFAKKVLKRENHIYENIYLFYYENIKIEIMLQVAEFAFAYQKPLYL